MILMLYKNPSNQELESLECVDVEEALLRVRELDRNAYFDPDAVRIYFVDNNPQGVKIKSETTITLTNL